MSLIDKALIEAVELGAKTAIARQAIAASERLVGEIFKVPAEAVAKRLSADHAGSLVTRLSNAHFSSIFSGEKVSQSFSGLPYSGTLHGEYSIGANSFKELHGSYSKFLKSFRDAHLTNASNSDHAYDEAIDVFDKEVVPHFAINDISVKRINASKGFAFKPTGDLPLNSKFETSGGSVNLNTVGGMRSYLLGEDAVSTHEALQTQLPSLDTDDGFVRAIARSMLPGGREPEFLSAPAADLLTAEQRTVMFKTAAKSPVFEKMIQPELLAALKSGESVKVPAVLNLELPSGAVQMPGLQRSLLYFEETTHLFQFLNQAPLTKYGAAVSRELENGNSALKAAADGIDPSNGYALVFENDLVGVLHEVGIEPPKIFLDQAPIYQRKEVFKIMTGSK